MENLSDLSIEDLQKLQEELNKEIESRNFKFKKLHNLLTNKDALNTLVRDKHSMKVLKDMGYVLHEDDASQVLVPNLLALFEGGN